MKLHLHEERLIRFAACPIVTVIHLLGPFKIVIGFSQSLSRGAKPADTCVVSGLPEHHGCGNHLPRQIEFDFTPSTAMIVSSNGGLVASGNQRRAARRADRCRDKCLGKPRSLRGKIVNMRGANRFLAIAREMSGHIIDNNPNNIGPADRFCSAKG